ncbi:MAG: FKBP-type peptidyl-prolyl cis-trans isomerase [Euryarchaeota archaeon]|nr:FKBP-type peptidyl-prolyl cis-trans isomerase [Euryarchaeota archaeon]
MAKAHDDAKKEDAPKAEGSAPAKEQALGPAVRNGDVIRLDFDAWRLDPDGEHLFDTTNEASAKEAEISKDGVKYSPVPMVVGVARVFAGLDKALAGAKVGEEKTIILDPLEGAGAKEPTNYKYFPFREFEKRKIDIEMGKEVVIDNKVGYITAITAGRVKVDFNKPLAGKKLKYKFKVAAVLDKIEEKVPAVIEMDYGTSEGFEVRKDGDCGVEIVLPDLCKYDNKWVLARFRIVSDLREYLNLASIKFIEIYVKKEEKKEHAADCKDPECKDAIHEHAGHDHIGNDHKH